MAEPANNDLNLRMPPPATQIELEPTTAAERFSASEQGLPAFGDSVPPLGPGLLDPNGPPVPRMWSGPPRTENTLPNVSAEDAILRAAETIRLARQRERDIEAAANANHVATATRAAAVAAAGAAADEPNAAATPGAGNGAAAAANEAVPAAVNEAVAPVAAEPPAAANGPVAAAPAAGDQGPAAAIGAAAAAENDRIARERERDVEVIANVNGAAAAPPAVVNGPAAAAPPGQGNGAPAAAAANANPDDRAGRRVFDEWVAAGNTPFNPDEYNWRAENRPHPLCPVFPPIPPNVHLNAMTDAERGEPGAYGNARLPFVVCMKREFTLEWVAVLNRCQVIWQHGNGSRRILFTRSFVEEHGGNYPATNERQMVIEYRVRFDVCSSRTSAFIRF